MTGWSPEIAPSRHDGQVIHLRQDIANGKIPCLSRHLPAAWWSLLPNAAGIRNCQADALNGQAKADNPVTLEAAGSVIHEAAEGTTPAFRHAGRADVRRL